MPSMHFTPLVRAAAAAAAPAPALPAGVRPGAPPHADLPLVVDLDGTLLRSDLLVETGLLFLREQPRRALSLARWLTRGKASLKALLAQNTNVDVADLPYDPAVISFISAERLRGREVVLATASHRLVAQRVADHLGLFDRVMATDGERNLSGHAKRDTLVAAYGQGGFDYAGDSHADLPVWRAARRSYVVNGSSLVVRRARAVGNVAAHLRSTRPALGEWVRALRAHQWLKNLLVFVPLAAAHRLGDPWLVLQAVFAFVCFCLCASSAYIVNDLLDLRDDRRHARKRLRPFAAGRLPIKAGLWVSPILLLIALALSLSQMSRGFSAVLIGYYAMTLHYSLILKRRMVIDVIALAALYTLRVIGGAAAIAITPSFWLLAFSVFMFLSLALVKRYAELHAAREPNSEVKVSGRGYYSADLPMVASLGAAAGYMAVLVLALYVNDPQTANLYRQRELIWLACPLVLTWISRVWLLAHRGQMNEDPVVFAARDRISLTIAALTAAVFALAT